MSVTVCPTCARVSSPQVCVRRQSPRPSSCWDKAWDLLSRGTVAELGCEHLPAHGLLLSRLRILHHHLAAGPLLLAGDHQEARTALARGLHLRAERARLDVGLDAEALTQLADERQ